jgi:putative nucleotidyltransferase-like protein
MVLNQPETLVSLTPPQWETVLRQARRANLLARFAVRLDDLGLLGRVPAAPRAHLEAAKVLWQAQEEGVRREVAHLCKALARTGVDVVLLKGAAYLYAGLPPARGRLFSDVDILVPRGALAEVEGALMLHGWATTHCNGHDQRYYRKWMHELPPMRHVSRQTVVDVHHAILPIAGRLKPDSGKLLASSVPVGPRLRVLAPPDMVLHAASHLILNEDLSGGLRDLADLDSLLRHFGQRTPFWQELASRASELDLERPLYYALRCAQRILETPIPDPTMRPAPVMDRLFALALEIPPGRRTALARRLLYVRAHWLRMPPIPLAWHLTVKAFRKAESEASRPAHN